MLSINIQDIFGAEALAEQRRMEMHHPDCNTIAALAEGLLDGEELERAAEHVACCPECNRIFMATAKELAREEAARQGFWQKRKLFALAASLILCVLAGTGLWQSGLLPVGGDSGYSGGSAPQVLVASVPLDGQLEAVLRQGEEGFDEEQIRELAALLADRGVQLAAVERVELAPSFMAQQKSMFRRPEEVQIRLQDGVLYLEVVTADKGDGDGEVELFFSPPPEE